MDDGYILLTPDNEPAQIVAQADPGQVFHLAPGIYRNVTFKPKDGQVFIGGDGVELNGAVVISDWLDEGDGTWTAPYREPAFSHGEGRNGMARFTEDLLVDGKPLLRVGFRDELVAGTFLYEAGRVRVTFDPTPHVTEALNTVAAFVGGQTKDVTLEHIAIRNYASMAQRGAVDAHDTTGWILSNVVATGNHGAGVAAGDGMRISGGSFSHNGQVGIHAWDADDLVIEGVTVSGNNYAGFSETWDAGGIKILTASNVTLRDCRVFGNDGFGLWFDWDNRGIDISGNEVHDNRRSGIFVEASYDARISGNLVGYNNTGGYVDGYWGSEILVTSSSGIEVRENQVVVARGQGIGFEQSPREDGRYGPHVSFGNVVTGNHVVMLVPGLNGFSDGPNAADVGDNLWDGNSYVSDRPENLWFTWGNRFLNATDPVSLPIEKTGKFTYVKDPAKDAWVPSAP